MSNKYTLNWYDIVKGIQMFVIASLVTTIAGFVMQPGFDVFTANWAEIGRTAVNAAVVSTVSYLIKNFFQGNTVQ
jgi:uncharacterized membrane protein YvlD (DUF360 family)